MLSTSTGTGRARSLALDPATTAVLAIECQQGVLGEGAFLGDLARDARDVIPSIARLLDAARAAGVLVAHATFDGPLGARYRGTAPLWRVAAPPTDDWRPGDPGTQVLPELLGDGDLVLARHHGLSPTGKTELLPVLRGHGVRTVVLAGVSLNVAVPLTAADAEAEGFRVVVARDAVAGTPREYGELVLTHTIAMLAKLATVAELEQAWRGGAVAGAAGPGR